VFGNEGPYAQQLLSDTIGKIVRYTLKPGQQLDETHAPFMPRYFMVMQGEGVFKGADDGDAVTCGPGSLVIFGSKEDNSIQAVDSELVVIGFLHWPTAG
jgi:quercetin dioxygenase-like cupin family protein